MMGVRKREALRSLVLTALAIFVMFIILFPPVYYIFIVSVTPGSTLATTKLELIPPHNASLDSYREVLFGFTGGSEISENFTGGTIEGTAQIQNGKLYVTNGKLIGKVKYGLHGAEVRGTSVKGGVRGRLGHDREPKVQRKS